MSTVLCSDRWQGAGHRRQIHRQIREGLGSAVLSLMGWGAGEECDAPGWCHLCNCLQGWWEESSGRVFFFFFRFIVDLFDLALFSLQQDLLYSYLSLPCGVWWWLSALCLLSPLELCFPSTSDNQVCQHRWISGDFCYYYTKYIFIKITKNKNVVLQEKDKV